MKAGSLDRVAIALFQVNMPDIRENWRDSKSIHKGGLESSRHATRYATLVRKLLPCPSMPGVLLHPDGMAGNFRRSFYPE